MIVETVAHPLKPRVDPPNLTILTSISVFPRSRVDSDEHIVEARGRQVQLGIFASAHVLLKRPPAFGELSTGPLQLYLVSVLAVYLWLTPDTKGNRMQEVISH